MAKHGKSKHTESKIEKDLRLIRVFDFGLIPRHLFDQIKGLEWDTDSFLKSSSLHAKNPLSLIYVYAERETHKIRGFLWLIINVFTHNLDAQMMSLDKEYWNAGALRQVIKFLRALQKQFKLRKITFRTTRPGAFLRLGAKPSKSIVMEG